MGDQIPGKNLFMMCKILNKNALGEIPKNFYVRYCKKEELDTWKTIHFDDPDLAKQYNRYMTDFFNLVYAPKGDLFYNRCVFACDINDKVVGTCFMWKAYNKVTTIHWFKVLKVFEGRGIGRGLLSVVMKSLTSDDYPVFLHTQPSSYRAIKLYTDLGFNLLSDPIIGYRNNDLEECLPILKKYMSINDFKNLKISKAPASFLQIVGSSSKIEF